MWEIFAEFSWVLSNKCIAAFSKASSGKIHFCPRSRKMLLTLVFFLLFCRLSVNWLLFEILTSKSKTDTKLFLKILSNHHSITILYTRNFGFCFAISHQFSGKKRFAILMTSLTINTRPRPNPSRWDKHFYRDEWDCCKWRGKRKKCILRTPSI